MAYGKRTFKRFKRTKKPWYKRKYSVAEIAGKAYNTAKYLRGIINSEKKNHLLTGTQTPDYNGSVSSLSLIAQGDDVTNRNGRSILAKGLTFSWGATMGTSASAFTILLCIDTSRNLNTAIPSCSDLLTSTGTVYAPISSLLSNAQGRFKVLKRFRANVHTYKPQVEGKCYIKLNHHIKFDGTAATVTDANIGYVYAFFISDSAGATADPTIIFQSKLHYYDN